MLVARLHTPASLSELRDGEGHGGLIHATYHELVGSCCGPASQILTAQLMIEHGVTLASVYGNNLGNHDAPEAYRSNTSPVPVFETFLENEVGEPAAVHLRRAYDGLGEGVSAYLDRLREGWPEAVYAAMAGSPSMFAACLKRGRSGVYYTATRESYAHALELRLDVLGGLPSTTPLERAASWLHVREDPATSNSGIEIDEWLRPFKLGAVAWCAAFATWCADLRRRAAVWQLVADARQAGTLHDGADRRHPPPGALCIFGRNGQSPLRPGQEGHASFYAVHAGPGVGWFVGGNQAADVDDTDQREGVTRQRRPMASILAWIAV